MQQCSLKKLAQHDCTDAPATPGNPACSAAQLRSEVGRDAAFFAGRPYCKIVCGASTAGYCDGVAAAANEAAERPMSDNADARSVAAAQAALMDFRNFQGALSRAGVSEAEIASRARRAVSLVQQICDRCSRAACQSRQAPMSQMELFGGNQVENGVGIQSSTEQDDERVKHVLVIEDDRAVGRIIERVAARDGYEVELVTDPLEGLRRLKESGSAYSVVIVDLTLPGMAGDELVRRAQELGVAAPVVVVSGLGEPHARAACKAASVNAFVSKPFTPSRLLDAMGAACAARSAG